MSTDDETKRFYLAMCVSYPPVFKPHPYLTDQAHHSGTKGLCDVCFDVVLRSTGLEDRTRRLIAEGAD